MASTSSLDRKLPDWPGRSSLRSSVLETEPSEDTWLGKNCKQRHVQSVVLPPVDNVRLQVYRTIQRTPIMTALRVLEHCTGEESKKGLSPKLVLQTEMGRVVNH